MGSVTEWSEDAQWIPVEDDSAPGRVRRIAVQRANALGFSEHRVGEVAIAATELATNLQRHAVRGVMLVRVRREVESGTIELLALDSGPGVADLSVLTRDGNSTAGTLGIGLGALMRLASSFDAHSVPGKGTVVLATFGSSPASPERPRVAGLTRSMNGEMSCGDAWAQRVDEGRTTLMLADGLGHGELAAIASREAVRTFLSNGETSSLEAIVRRLDGALKSTRGAALALLRIDRAGQKVRFAGVGNVSAWIDDGQRRQGLISNPGIVGSNAKKVREIEVPLPDNAVIVMHSDGISSKWDLNAYPGLRTRDPRVLAATLLRDAGIHHDDASIVVA